MYLLLDKFQVSYPGYIVLIIYGISNHDAIEGTSTAYNTLFFISSNSILQDWSHFIDNL